MTYMSTWIPHVEMDKNVRHTREELDLVYNLWPENFLGLYDMGFRAFERLFNLRPTLIAVMGFTEDTWRKDEKMKRIVLALEQMLVKSVATYADHNEEDQTPDEFAIYMQEIGGLHRAIVPNISPDNFELLFKLLPEVIADVTSARRETPLTPQDRATYVLVWNSICVICNKHFLIGWERRVIPKIPKFEEIYSDRMTSDTHQQSSSQTATASQTQVSYVVVSLIDMFFVGRTCPISRRTPSRTGPHRSSTQVEMTANTGPSVSSGSWLERGNSAPITLHELDLEFQELSSS